jgi:hypothetical protein
MMRRALPAALAAIVAIPAFAHAQSDSVIPRVRGVVFDSIRGRPLANAFVGVVGGSSSTQTDARGRFQLDSVAGGTYVVVVQHPALDSLGFPGIRQRVRFTGNEDVRIATPSFASLWRRMCGDRAVPDDSGFVYGIVRDIATDRPISDAVVSVVWRDSLRRVPSTVERSEAAKQAEAFEKARRKRKTDPIVPFDIPTRPPISSQDAANVASMVKLRLQVLTDSTGVYRVCGVPQNAADARVSVLTDTTESDSIDVRVDAKVHRRDMRVAVMPGTKLGVVAGQLLDRSANVVPYARVSINGAGEARSDDSGRFVLRGVEPGTRLMEVRFIGTTPTRAVIDLASGDSVFTTISLDRTPMLGTMNVRAAGLGRVLAAEFTSRRQMGLGYIVDSTFISKYNSVENVMREVPGLVVQRKGIDIKMLIPDGRGGMCEPTMYMDGVLAGTGHLFDLTTKEAVALEAYVQPLTVPTPYVRPGGDRKCGAILVWTKYGFTNR